MYIDTTYSTQQGRTYRRHLFRESFREKERVKHQTLANLSPGTDEEIEGLKLALKHKGNLTELISVEEIDTK